LELLARRRIATWAAIFAAVVGCVAAAAGPKKKPPPAKPINLNQATIEQLEELPSVGPVTARTIVRFREKSGRFKRVEDLLAVRGISRGRFEKIRPYVFVGPAARKEDPKGSGDKTNSPEQNPGRQPIAS
jgi:competence ComEA-like helix-hairpin-helix protein